MLVKLLISVCWLIVTFGFGYVYLAFFLMARMGNPSLGTDIIGGMIALTIWTIWVLLSWRAARQIFSDPRAS